MTTYESYLQLPDHFAVGDLPRLLEKLREQAFAEFLFEQECPVAVRIVWETDNGLNEFGIAAHIEEVQAFYHDLRIPRPEAEDAPDTIETVNPLKGPKTVTATSGTTRLVRTTIPSSNKPVR